MRKILSLLLLSLLPVFARAEEPGWETLQLDMQAGLADNCVNDVLMDGRQLVWIGTNAGLDLYDGCNIVHIPFWDVGNVIQPVVFSLVEDSAGIIWAGTSDGLYCMDRNRCEMQRSPLPGLDQGSIRMMAYSRGNLWLGDPGSDLIKLCTASGEPVHFPITCKAVCSRKDGGVYILSKNGQLYLSGDGESAPECLKDISLQALSKEDISRIRSAGNFLLLSTKEGTYALDFRSLEIRKIPEIYRMRDVLTHSSGEYWLSARDGIHILDSTLVQTGILRPFHDNSFRCLKEDDRGRVWAGTLFEGLARIAPDELQYRHYTQSFAGGAFKARDFAETPDGRIWIGSDTRGLLCLDPQHKEVRTYFPGRNVTGLMAEGNQLWVGTIDSDLPVAKLDTETGRITLFPDAGTSAYAFCRDTTGRLWIGGKDGFVAGRDTEGGRFEREIFIPTSQVCRILCAADGSVWVASIGGQVFHYTSASFSTLNAPISNILTDIAEDGNGRIFATSEGGGLSEYDPSQDRFLPRAGAETQLLKIARDGRLLWITGAHGIHLLNPNDNRKLPVISREALGIDGFNYSSNFISADGTLYAGTSDGFISFSVRKMTESAPEGGKPVISSLCILSSEETADKRFLSPTSLTLGRKARSFAVNVSPMDYTRFPLRTLYWKIDGFNDWTPVQNGTFTVYDIPAGKWKLRLKALSLSGDESDETRLELRVQPHILLSPLAILLYLLLFVLAAVGSAMLANRRAKQKAAREHERKLLESKMEFLTSIAHEIRTPLSLVQIPLEALIRKFSSSADGSVQENLDIMRRNSLKLTVLINELLDFRKLTDSTFQIHPEFLDLRGILKDAHRRFLPTFMQEGKTLSVSIPDAPIYCETDVRSVGRIFDNLLSNALKYSRHHTSITMSVSGNDAVVSVENDGAVLPSDVRELIFQPFYRHEDSASANVEGTGLGLSTSRQFASLLGGSLSMDDDLKVNRFIFTIPVSASKAPDTGLPVVETKDKSVMVVEDDKDMARVIGDILSESYNIIYAYNGREAIDKIGSGASPTLVVSDVMMPEMDGIALTKALKGSLATSHIPVILLSAEVPDVFMQESLEGGADAYLEKPFSPKKLRSTVDNLIENRKRVYEFYISSLPSDGELPTGRVSAQEQKFLRSIQEYVGANLHRSITLDDLAEVVCLSPSTLYKKMKDYADVSPMEYVMKVRLHRAVELLKDDSVSVQEVAQAVGFNTHSFFSECFKREFGMTPRQWRNRNLAKSKK